MSQPWTAVSASEHKMSSEDRVVKMFCQWSWQQNLASKTKCTAGASLKRRSQNRRGGGALCSGAHTFRLLNSGEAKASKRSFSQGKKNAEQWKMKVFASKSCFRCVRGRRNWESGLHVTSDQHLINMALMVAMHNDVLGPFLKCDNFSVRDVREYLSRISALQIVRQVQHFLIDGNSHLSIFICSIYLTGYLHCCLKCFPSISRACQEKLHYGICIEEVWDTCAGTSATWLDENGLDWVGLD